MLRALGLTCLALLLPATASAKVVTETAQQGSIVATISYEPDAQFGAAKDIRMTVFDGERQIVDDTIPDDAFLRPLQESFFDDKAVGVRDFDGDGTPEAVFDFFTGGAHCCVQSRLYDGGTLVEQDWGNVGYRLKDYDGDGVPEFDTEDDAFSGRFSSYAASMRPIRVMQYRDGAFDDRFTRDASVMPRVVKERRTFLRLYRKYARKSRRDPIYQEVVRSALGALTADDCLLGDCARGYAQVDKALAKGLVRKSFVRQLRRLLRSRGYEA